MSRIYPQVIPPGTIFIFDWELDSNEDNIFRTTGGDGVVTRNGVATDNGGNPIYPEDADYDERKIPQSYADPPVIRQTSPIDLEYEQPPGNRNISVDVKDSVNVGETSIEAFNAIPSVIQGIDWVDPDYARVADGNNAYINDDPVDYNVY